jgi:hypothetical protein
VRNTTIYDPAPLVFQLNNSFTANAFVDGSYYIRYAEIPEFKLSPTRELFDRLTELKSQYSTPLFPKSVAPIDQAFEDARNFILTLPLNRIIKPSIHIASDGEVNFQWSGADFKIDLGFYGNNKFSFYAAKQGTEPVLGDDVSVKDGIPEALISFASAA